MRVLNVIFWQSTNIENTPFVQLTIRYS